MRIRVEPTCDCCGFLSIQVMDLFQAPLLVLIKSATILHDDAFLDIYPVAWELLLDFHKETVGPSSPLREPTPNLT